LLRQTDGTGQVVSNGAIFNREGNLLHRVLLGLESGGEMAGNLLRNRWVLWYVSITY
jgi:hypothetical protein